MLKAAITQLSKPFKFAFQFCSLILVLIIIIPASTFGQGMHADNIMPVYPGGLAALKETIAKNLQYPEAALKAGVSGSVLVNFTIDSEGKIQNIKVMQGISPECDIEAVRVTRLLNGWEPGRRQGKPVNITISMPVEFKSDKKLSPTTVSGKVTEKVSGKAIEGAFVIVKGTDIGSVTNEEGLYRIDLPASGKDLLIFSVGYSSKEISIDFHPTINVELESEYLLIDFESDLK